MSQPITAGDFKNALNLLKGWSDKLFKLFDDLIKTEGYKVEEVKETSTGGMEYKVTAGNGAFTCKLVLTPVKNHNGFYDMEIHTEDGKAPLVSKNISEGAIEKELKSQLHNFSDVKIEQSQKINVKLHKVMSGTDCNIELSGIYASDYVRAYDIVEDLLQNNEFVDTLPKEPTAYEVCDSGDCYEVDICEVCPTDICGKINICTNYAYRLILAFKTIHWYAGREDFEELHKLADEFVTMVEDDMDTLGEIGMKLCHRVDVSDITCSPIICSHDYVVIDKLSGVGMMQQWIRDYICMLNSLYVDLPHDTQPTIDRMIDGWKQQSEYLLDRILVQ